MSLVILMVAVSVSVYGEHEGVFIRLSILYLREDIWNLGSMSTKALVRQKDTLVDRGNNPIEGGVNGLKNE